jgi:cell division transport system permease protein
MRVFSYVGKNIRRTPYQALAATMIMFLTFLTLLLFMVIALGSQRILQYYESKPQAIAFFKDNATQVDVDAIRGALQATGRVTDLRFVSKEEALQIYKDKNADNPTLLELVTANILPASLEISTVTPGDLKYVAQILQQEPVVEEVVVPEDVIQTLTKATGIIRWVGGVSVGFLIGFSILVILMIIGFKIRIKRNEIEIMRLLGASTWFIRAPFLWEGIAYAAMGAVAAWITTYAVIWYFTPFIQPSLAEINLLPISPLIMLQLLAIALLSAVIIGFIGSFSAVRRYLK